MLRAKRRRTRMYDKAGNPIFNTKNATPLQRRYTNQNTHLKQLQNCRCKVCNSSSCEGGCSFCGCHHPCTSSDAGWDEYHRALIGEYIEISGIPGSVATNVFNSSNAGRYYYVDKYLYKSELHDYYFCYTAAGGQAGKDKTSAWILSSKLPFPPRLDNPVLLQPTIEYYQWILLATSDNIDTVEKLIASPAYTGANPWFSVHSTYVDADGTITPHPKHTETHNKHKYLFTSYKCCKGAPQRNPILGYRRQLLCNDMCPQPPIGLPPGILVTIPSKSKDGTPIPSPLLQLDSSIVGPYEYDSNDLWVYRANNAVIFFLNIGAGGGMWVIGNCQGAATRANLFDLPACFLPFPTYLGPLLQGVVYYDGTNVPNILDLSSYVPGQGNWSSTLSAVSGPANISVHLKASGQVRGKHSEHITKTALNITYKDNYARICGTFRKNPPEYIHVDASGSETPASSNTFLYNAGTCGYSQTKPHIQNRGGWINDKYNYTFKQYLERRCRTFKDLEFNFLSDQPLTDISNNCSEFPTICGACISLKGTITHYTHAYAHNNPLTITVCGSNATLIWTWTSTSGGGGPVNHTQLATATPTKDKWYYSFRSPGYYYSDFNNGLWYNESGANAGTYTITSITHQSCKSLDPCTSTCAKKGYTACEATNNNCKAVYKRSNSSFSRQGAVSGGSRINRLKYQTVLKAQSVYKPGTEGTRNKNVSYGGTPYAAVNTTGSINAINGAYPVSLYRNTYPKYKSHLSGLCLGNAGRTANDKPQRCKMPAAPPACRIIQTLPQRCVFPTGQLGQSAWTNYHKQLIGSYFEVSIASITQFCDFPCIRSFASANAGRYFYIQEGQYRSENADSGGNHRYLSYLDKSITGVLSFPSSGWVFALEPLTSIVINMTTDTRPLVWGLCFDPSAFPTGCPSLQSYLSIHSYWRWFTTRCGGAGGWCEVLSDWDFSFSPSHTIAHNRHYPRHYDCVL